MEIENYISVIRRWLWLLVLMTVVSAGVSFLLVQQQAPTYSTQTSLLVSPGINNPDWDLSVLRSSREVMQTYSELTKTRPFLEQVIADLGLKMTPNQLAGQVTVLPNPDTLIMVITVRSPSQTQAVAIANGMANALMRLYSYKPNGSTPNPASLSAQATQLEERIATSQARIKQLEAELKTASEGTSTQATIELQNKIKALEAQLAASTDPALTKRIQDRQARIAQLETMLKATANFDARRLILDEVGREDRLLAADTALLTDQKRLINDQLNQERARLSSMQSDSLSRQGQITSQLSNERALLAEAQKGLAALYSRQITLLSPATSASAETNKSLIVIVATFAGLVLGLTLAFLFEYLDDRIRTAEQLTDATGVQVWGLVGKHPVFLQQGQMDKRLTAPNDGRVAEAFRWLCMRLTPNTNSNACSLLVTSFENGNKVTEVASNLAITLTRAGKRVILVDADLRRPTLSKLFNLKNGEGLADYLTDGIHGPKLVPVEWAPGLSILTAGNVGPETTQELVWPRMEDLIRLVENKADILIVAGPPMSSSADSFFLASRLGGVLAVAQSGKTRRKIARDIVDNLQSLGIQVLGLILADGGKAGFRTLYTPSTRGIYSYEQRLLSGPRMSRRPDPTKD